MDWKLRTSRGSRDFDPQYAERQITIHIYCQNLLTQALHTASFNVNKDGVKVTVLTFTKSAYRLGETVVGAVEINERGGRSRVLKVSRL